MSELKRLAAELAARLRQRGETIAVSESSAGGLVSAALLAEAGASAYFMGGAVVYTAAARDGLLGITPAAMDGLRSASEPYAQLLASTTRQRLGSTWGLAETGAAGPSGNRYGDPAGHMCCAVSGPRDLVRTVETGSADRAANMETFAATALALVLEAVSGAEPA
ncbi:CinA family protein [Methylobacterium oryzihabitans]|uniref:CinA family protein n=1 Tax=Methylobacterium oryzihabitans TaxID=2499852 RepID=A0A437PC39_9HYPH|nr:CinA family protein [Methylobacterium oryzihabitans]RVU19819.1 CinA family protein [Methylobacterium oryzihabitans]